jgi:uncharacterized integral membrane protein
MQLTLIIGIVVAIGAVLFALQNDTPVTVSLAMLSFEGSLALVLLIALGLGALIAGLVTSPTVIRGQWQGARLNRRVAELERKLSEQDRRNAELRVELAAARARVPEAATVEGEVVAEQKPYVGLRTLLRGEDDGKAAVEKES